MNDIDTDPVNPLDVRIELLIPSVTAGVPYYTNGTDLGWISSVFVEYTTGTFSKMRSVDRRQNINSKLANNAWLNVYTGPLKNLKIIIDKGSFGGEEEGNWKYVGIAQVLYAYTFSVVTDIWGQVPFKEALEGADGRKPAYDKQQEIYDDLHIMLDSAIVNLQKTSIQTPGEEDLIYQGKTEKWVKAAWALKARLYNHCSKRKPQESATNALNCIKNAFDSPDDDMVFSEWSGSDDINNQNPWYRHHEERGELSISKTIYDLMNGLRDPRIPVYFDTAKVFIFSPFIPAPNGTADEDAAGTKYSKIAEGFLYEDVPLPMLTYEEMMFIKAEAELRLNNKPLANNAYEMALAAALERTEISDIESLYYRIQNSVSPSQEGISLRHIIQQKYIALYPYQSIEAYNDFRRTGYPSMNNPYGTPERFPYPQNEISTNGDNVPDVEINDGVWWDDGTE